MPARSERFPKPGDRFGLLTVLEIVRIADSANHSYACARVLCDCGSINTTRTDSLLRGSSPCRCVKRGRPRLPDARKRRRLYRIWVGMKSRCFTKSAKSYCHYGGRGITVCDEWHSYDAFERWAHNNGYDKELTLDRIDTNGDYCPENCRWATTLQQQNNRRSHVRLTVWGETKNLAEWSRDSRCKCKFGTLESRIRNFGWDVERAISTPTRHYHRRI